MQVNGAIIRMQAEKLQHEANKRLNENEKLSLKFSNGWLARFQNRHDLKFRRVHGEALSADVDALNKAIPEIRAKISKYSRRDVWNADEFGLFYRQPPGWTLSKTPVSGHKQDKTRITCLACCNWDGSEKFPLMVIGRANRPRPFGKKSGQELGFDYHHNKKAWMNQVLFLRGCIVLTSIFRESRAERLFFSSTIVPRMEQMTRFQR